MREAGGDARRPRVDARRPRVDARRPEVDARGHCERTWTPEAAERGTGGRGGEGGQFGVMYEAGGAELSSLSDKDFKHLRALQLRALV